MQLLAVFQLTHSDQVAASLHNLETKELIDIVEDNPSDTRPFNKQVEAWAKANGHEIAEWDRSALHATA